jgi:hypothetical protein
MRQGMVCSDGDSPFDILSSALSFHGLFLPAANPPDISSPHLRQPFLHPSQQTAITAALVGKYSRRLHGHPIHLHAASVRRLSHPASGSIHSTADPDAECKAIPCPPVQAKSMGRSPDDRPNHDVPPVSHSIHRTLVQRSPS